MNLEQMYQILLPVSTDLLASGVVIFGMTGRVGPATLAMMWVCPAHRALTGVCTLGRA
ncbi:MAG: hypothetical protein AB8G95_28775 [Anaerolineae bacterium]